jgi:hypothetical protein
MALANKPGMPVEGTTSWGVFRHRAGLPGQSRPIGHNSFVGDVMWELPSMREDIGGENRTVLESLYSVHYRLHCSILVDATRGSR